MFLLYNEDVSSMQGQLLCIHKYIYIILEKHGIVVLVPEAADALALWETFCRSFIFVLGFKLGYALGHFWLGPVILLFLLITLIIMRYILDRARSSELKEGLPMKKSERKFGFGLAGCEAIWVILASKISSQPVLA